MDDTLPAALTQGPPRLLTYKLSMLNRAEKSYGESNPAYAIAGVAPAPVTGFSAMPKRKGIVLSWQAMDVPPGSSDWIQFDRTHTTAAPVPDQAPVRPQNALPGRKTSEEPSEQIFRVPETAGSQP